jgi:hypothetical protein
MLPAALAYFAIVFAVGFACGPIRVMWLEPNFGATTAVLMEMPILLMAMMFAARYVPRRMALPATAGMHLGMGLIALGLVLTADIGVGLWVRGQSPAEIGAYFLSTPGRIYSASLLIFGLMPVLVNRRRRHRPVAASKQP